MIYAWDIARFRQALDQGLQSPHFEQFRFATEVVHVAPAEDIRRKSEPATVAQMKGASRVFGQPIIQECMTGISAGKLPMPPSSLYVVPAARVVGLNTLLDSNERLFSPDPCTDASLLSGALQRNSSNAEGYVLRQIGGQYFASFFEPSPGQCIAKKAILLSNLEINNYGSFLIRVLPQLLMIASSQCEFDCYIASDRSAWLREALALVGLPQKPIYLVQEVCGNRFDEVIVLSSATIEGFFDSKTLQAVRSLTDKVNGGAPPSRRLFVSRQLSRIFLPHYRMLANEAEVAALFERNGFEIVFPETLSLSQQINLFNQAKVIAGASGSGMLNAIFAPAGGKVLDIESFNVTVRQHAKVYASTGKEYAFLFGKFDALDDRDPTLRRWSVDLSLVDEAIGWLSA